MQLYARARQHDITTSTRSAAATLNRNCTTHSSAGATSEHNVAASPICSRRGTTSKRRRATHTRISGTDGNRHRTGTSTLRCTRSDEQRTRIAALRNSRAQHHLATLSRVCCCNVDCTTRTGSAAATLQRHYTAYTRAAPTSSDGDITARRSAIASGKNDAASLH